jgi:beta-glucan synthesis-associated protein KRE6
MHGNFNLIDTDTPESALTRTSIADGSTWDLVFSDEFNLDGRSFYPGDDPYWEAENLHYWGTNNLEWYDPSAATTKDGSLVITLDKTPTHGLDYQSAMITSWNKFCFTGGYIEVNVSLPGTSTVWGLWPAVWTMGNLGRAGYGASLDGTWPYSYDSCDLGTLRNQTLNGAPASSLTSGDPAYGGGLSYLPGQRLSACTCKGEDHPGPKRGDGFVGRSAPEIDIFEALVDSGTKIGQVSQSAQWAPFNDAYMWCVSSPLAFDDLAYSYSHVEYIGKTPRTI